MNIEAILSKFNNVKQTKQNHWMAQCPCHNDSKSSLSIAYTNNKALIYCFAGCQIEDILKASGLLFADLYSENIGTTEAIYQYRNSDGSLSHEKVKIRKRDKGKEFRQRRIDENGDIVDNLENVDRIPYQYPEVINAIKAKMPILYLEGEKDCNTAKILGYTATTMGGAGDWKPEYASKYFKGANLYLVPDKDSAGLNLTGGKMIDSLKPVTKTLKCIILPTGKDLTEWVQVGGKDLKPLMAEAIELPTALTFPDPVMTKTISGYNFTWDNLGLRIYISRLNDDTECEITVFDNDKIIHIGKCKLLSTVNINQLKKTLSEIKSIDWQTILTKVTQKCLEAIRQGLEVDNIDDEPINEKVEYLIYPILFLNEPTVIFAPGGSGKSTFMDYLSVLVSYGMSNGTGWSVTKANVLYLDWEDTSNTHKRRIKAIKKGLGITDKSNIIYSHCSNSIFDIIDDIKKLVVENNIKLVIVDSQEACISNRSYAINESQAVQLCHNLLRALNCTVIIVDHVSKASINGTTTTSPIGTVSKINRCRCEYEFTSDNDTFSDSLPCSIVQKKNNLTRLLSPFGLTFNYTFKDKDHLIYDTITMKTNNLDETDSDKLKDKMTQQQRIIEAIKDCGGQADLSEIAEKLKITNQEDREKISKSASKLVKSNILVRLTEGTYAIVTTDYKETDGGEDVVF